MPFLCYKAEKVMKALKKNYENFQLKERHLIVENFSSENVQKCVQLYVIFIVIKHASSFFLFFNMIDIIYLLCK